ncbi:ABC transporter substrate-binding protein [Muricoccus radiodurans]|uniref:ABC transporter substrate-binding protein n=1 Tax=Muricoccus radiodurans TaxID=2231721 RepID=UPI003CECE6E6
MAMDRRGLMGLGAAGALTAFGRPARAQLREGRPFAGQTVNVLLPVASQFRAHEKRLPDFERLTGIKAAFTYVPYGQLRDKITTEAVAGGSAFDVICYQDSWGSSLANSMVALDDLLRRDGISMDRYPQAYKLGSQVEGRTYGLPIRGHPQMLFYRKDLLEAAGVAPPTNWDEVVTASNAVQAKNPNISGIAMYYGKGNGQQNLFLWLNHLWGRGGDVLTADERGARFNDDIGVQATQQYLDYLLRHRVAAPGSLQFVEGDAVNSVAQGNSAMVVVWWWVYSVLTGPQSRLTADQVGFAPVPQMAGGQPVSYAISLPLALSSGSRRRDAAWEFMKWVTAAEQEVAVATDKSDPNLADIVVTHTASFSNEAVNAANGGLHRVAARSLEGSRIMPQTRDWPQVAAVLENTLSELASTRGPVKPALDNAARETDRILRRSGRR